MARQGGAAPPAEAPGLEGYSVKEELGRGAFAVVHRVVCTRSGAEHAAKFIHHGGAEEDRAKVGRCAAAEARALETAAGHAHVLQMLSRVAGERHAVVVTELLLGEELHRRVAREGCSERAARRTFTQLAGAFAHLAARGVIHRDVKPPNLVYASLQSDAPVKVVDFGSAVCVDPAAPEGTHGVVGTLRYMAPEMQAKKSYSTQADVWGLGAALHLLLTGADAFPQTSVLQLRSAVKAGQVDWETDPWDAVGADARGLCQELLLVDPSARLTASQALDHEWCGGSGSRRPSSAAPLGAGASPQPEQQPPAQRPDAAAGAAAAAAPTAAAPAAAAAALAAACAPAPSPEPQERGTPPREPPPAPESDPEAQRAGAAAAVSSLLCSVADSVLLRPGCGGSALRIPLAVLSARYPGAPLTRAAAAAQERRKQKGEAEVHVACSSESCRAVAEWVAEGRRPEPEQRRSAGAVASALGISDLAAACAAADQSLTQQGLWDALRGGAPLRLSGRTMRGLVLRGLPLRQAELSGSDLSGARLDAADLSGAVLRGADLRQASLRRCRLHGACLAGADLRGADFTGAELGGADFAGAQLADARMPAGGPETEPAPAAPWQPLQDAAR